MKKTLFTDGWRFALAGEEPRPVRLPHDAMLLSGRDPASPGGSGCAYFKGGVYRYEKDWEVSPALAAGRAVLHFEGVYRNARVTLNGEELGAKRYGYAPFWIDLTGKLRPGRNCLRVTADNSELPNSRWYTGGGIYRPVWLLQGGQNAIRPCGLKLRTLSLEPAVVHVSLEPYEREGVSARIEILRDGVLMAEGRGLEADITVPDAALWSDEQPALYTCRAVLTAGDRELDEAECDFGIRTLSLTPQGFFLNGRETKLRGGCVHADNGILGAASFPESEYRKARLLKEAGFNALRMAHNPASPALLAACDRLGLLVMDEGWDMWYKRKTKHDYGGCFLEDWRDDVRAMVDTDYNHPCVVFYSIGNENSEPATARGVELAGSLAAAFRELDGTRPVTVGCNLTILADSQRGSETFDPESESSNGVHEGEPAGMDSTAFNAFIASFGAQMELSANSEAADRASAPLFEQLDLAGYNYAYGRYELDRVLHPERVMVGSETFPQCIRRNWQAVKAIPALIGDFMWTALDYIGEVGLGAWSYSDDGNNFTKPWPWLLAEAGALDLIGTPTGEMLMAQNAWGLLAGPGLAVRPDLCYPGVVPAKGPWRGTNAVPSWSFRGCEGREATVEVHSEAPRAALLLNGRLIGEGETEEGLALFTLPFEPGTLEAVALDAAGQECGRSSLRSAEGRLRLRLCAEEGPAPREAGSLVYVRVEIVGENGDVESNADGEIVLSVEGGTLLGFGSARARSAEDFTAGRYTTYYGRALAALRPEGSGAVRLTAYYAGEAYSLEL